MLYLVLCFKFLKELDNALFFESELFKHSDELWITWNSSVPKLSSIYHKSFGYSWQVLVPFDSFDDFLWNPWSGLIRCIA